jgi:hypothetical protein
MPFNMFGQNEDEDELNIAAQPPMGQPPAVEQPLPVGVEPSEEDAPSSAPANTAGAAPSDSNFQITNPLVKLWGDKYSDEARQKLIDEAPTTSFGGSLLTGLGAALGGKDASGAMEQYEKAPRDALNSKLATFDKGRQGITDNFKSGLDIQKSIEDQKTLGDERNPNSDASKIAQQAALKWGIAPELAKKMTAAQFKAQGPIFEQMFKVEQLAQAKKESAARLGNERADKQNDLLAKNLKDDLNPNKMRGGNMAKNQARIDQADRLKALYTDSNGDIRNLDSRQMEEFAIGTNKLLSDASTGASSQIAALVPKTARGDAQKLKEWLTNDPTGTDQIEFVKRMAETVQREREVADGQVKKAQIALLPAYAKLKKSNPELYKSIINAQGVNEEDIDEKGQYKGHKKDEGGGVIQVRNPKTGAVHAVKQSELKDAIAAGGQLVTPDSQVAGGPNPNGGRYQ